MKEDKDIKTYIICIFVLSMLFRYALSVKTATVNIIYDELLYWDISNSIINYGSTMFRNLLVSNKDLLYPLSIMCAHLFNNFDMAYKMILLINAFIMSSVIFPTYKLSELFFDNKKINTCIAIVSVLVPEMFYTTRIVQENLYYPMVMWAFYFFVHYIIEDKYNIKKVTLFALYICVLTHVKMIALCILGGLVFFYLFQIFVENDKKQRVQNIMIIAESIIIYIIGKSAIGGIVEHFIAQSAGDSVVSLTGSALNNLLNLENIIGYIYPIMSYIVFCGLFLGIFSVLIPVAYYSELDEKSKGLLLFALGVAMVTVGVICLLILNADSEIGARVTRIHFRYLFYVYIPFLILYIKSYSIVKNQGINWKLISLAAFYCICVLITVPKIAVGSEIDSIPANSLQAFFMTENRQLLFKVIVISGVCIGCAFIYAKKIKLMYMGVLVVLACFSLHSTQKAYRISHEENAILVRYQEDGKNVSLFLKDKVEMLDDVWIVAYNKASSGVMEVSLDIPYRVCVMDEFVNSNMSNKEDASCDQLNFYHIDSYQLTSYENPEYIISQGQLELSKYQLIDIGLNNFYLYQKITK